jgi:hypothetical protein
MIKDLFLWFRGRRAEAVAHWGLVLPPPDQRKIFWLYTGATAEEVTLAVEILGAIRQKRLDLRLIFTFARDYPELFSQKLSHFQKLALGFSPHDHPWALQNFYQRMTPFAWLAVGRPPYRHWPKALKNVPAGIFVGDIAQLQAADWPKLQRIYPQSAYDTKTLREEQQQKIAAVADLRALLAETEIDAKLKALLLPPFQEQAEAQVWLLAGGSLNVEGWQAWQASPLANSGFLAVEKLAFDLAKNLSEKNIVALSTWQRQALPVGSVLWLDETRWLPGIIGAASGIYFQELPKVIWPYLAGSAAISVVEELKAAWTWPALTQKSWPETLRYWENLRENPLTQRQQADLARKQLWQARRAAQAQLQDLLTVVFEW